MIGSSFYNADILFATLNRKKFHISRGQDLDSFFEKETKRKKLVLLDGVNALKELKYIKDFRKAVWLIFDVPLNLKKYGLDVVDGVQVDDEIIWKPIKLDPKAWNTLLENTEPDFKYKKEKKKPETNKLGMKSIFGKKK